MKYDKNMKMFTFEEGSNIMVVTLFQNVYLFLSNLGPKSDC